MMSWLFVVGAIMLVSIVFVWALYCYCNDELNTSKWMSSVEHHSLNELGNNIDFLPDTEPKMTPSTTQLDISPSIIGHPLKHIPVTLSGMGSCWQPLRKIVPKRHRRYLHREDVVKHV